METVINGKSNYDAGYVVSKTASVELYSSPANEAARVEIKAGSTIVKSEENTPDKFVITLDEGKNTVTAQVIAKNGSKGDLVTITIVRETADETKSNKDLDFVKYGYKKAPDQYIDLGEIVNFDEPITININNDISTIYLQAIPVVPAASGTPGDNVEVVVNGGSPIVISQNKYEIPLNEGDNTVTITVTALDGTKKTYTLTLHRWTNEESNTGVKVTDILGNNFTIPSDGKHYVLPNITSISLTATAESSLSTVSFNDEEPANKVSKAFSLEKYEAKVKITVMAKSGDYAVHEFIIYRHKENVQLKKLKLTQSDNEIAFDFNPANENISAIVDAISAEKQLTIEATAAKTGSKVKIGDNAEETDTSTKTYSTEQSSITITVSEGENSKTYKLTLEERKPKTDVKINLIGSFGGSNVVGTKVKVYDRGENNVLQEQTTDADGNVTFSLASNKYYDFVAVPNNKRGASKIENVFVSGASQQDIVMIQRKKASGFLSKAPEILEMKYATKTGTTVTPKAEFDNMYELNAETLESDKGGIYVKFKCAKGSGAIGNINSSDGNFGVAINVGTSASSRAYAAQGELKKKTIKEDGSMEFEYFIPLNKTGFPDGISTLYLVAYDVAGNRVERQVPVRFVAKTTSTSIVGATIENFYVNIQRFSKSLNAYGHKEDNITTLGLKPHNDYETSYNSLFIFWVKDKYGIDLPINGYDIYRREYKADAKIDENWELASKKVYPSSYAGNTNPSIKGSHWGNDTDNRLKEDTVYQYKVVAFTDAFDRVSSPVITSAVLPAFHVEQQRPKENATIKKADLANTEFTFKITNRALWDSKADWAKPEADYFRFGLLLVDKASNGDVVYTAKMNYHFNKTGDDRLDITIWDPQAKKAVFLPLSQWKKLHDTYGNYFIPTDTTVEDLINYDKSTGVVTITKKFLSIGKFNTWNLKPLKDALNINHTYFWDIQDFGNDPRNWQDDMAASFIKEWKVLDSITGEVIEDHEVSRARSGANVGGNDSAITGRWALSISE